MLRLFPPIIKVKVLHNCNCDADLSFRVFPRRAVGAWAEFVGFEVVEDLFFLTVPFKAAAGTPGNHAEEGENGGAVAHFNAGNGGTFLSDGVHEISPEEREIMAVGFL